MTKNIYVEILIRAPLEQLWAHTQTPELHEQWDLRFSEIHYLPKTDAAEPQRFRYATRLGFGLNSETRGCIVDYLGTHEHLAVDIDLSVDAEGGLCLRSGAQRFYEGPIGFRFPMLFSGLANVREWY